MVEKFLSLAYIHQLLACQFLVKYADLGRSMSDDGVSATTS